MPQIRLIASSYQLSNTSYLKIADTENMYTNTDSDTYATITHNRAATTAYYVYVRGFSFSDVPEDAVITSATVKVKARAINCGAQTPILYNGTTSLSKNLSGTITTTTYTRTADITSSFDTYKGYGNNFGVRFQLNRSSRNTISYLYIYGAEILVEYTLPVSWSVYTGINEGSGTIDPNGTTMVSDTKSFTCKIYPGDGCTSVRVDDNGIDVTNQLIEVPNTGTTNCGAPTARTTSGSFSSSSYLAYAIGYSAESYNTSTSNAYCSSSGSTAKAFYSFDTSGVPSNATILSVTCKVAAHAESSSNASETCQAQLYYNKSEARGDLLDFKSTGTAITTKSISDGGNWTRAELDSLSLCMTLGYYGGLLNGATLTVSYSLGSGTHYEYTISSVTEAHSILVSFISDSDKVYLKINSNWFEGIAYKKNNGVWTAITPADLSGYLSGKTMVHVEA